jgi:UDP-3-O-[3-hydroxymyristoyl] glucosamine N-acyltransferase
MIMKSVANMISINATISSTAKIGDNVTICDGCIVGDNVIIGDNTYLDYGVIIRNNVSLGADSFVGARCILGEYLASFINKRIEDFPKLIIGHHAVIRSESIIYGGTIIEDDFQTGHRVTIREQAEIGNHVKVGTLSDIQGYCSIGDYSRMHSNVHVGQKTKIGRFVMIFPYVVFTNDPTPPSRPISGVTVEDFAIISTGSIILPGVHIGKDCLIGASANVTKDVADEAIIVGNPGKDIGSVRKITNKFTGQQVYPWRYTFDEGMPWEGVGYQSWLDSLSEEDKASFGLSTEEK